MTPTVINLMGKRFGKLTVIEFAGTESHTGRSVKRARWVCRCDCGNMTTIDSTVLRRGKVVGCGKCRTNVVNQHGSYDLRTYDSSFNEFFRTVKNSAKIRNLVFDLTEQDVRKISKQNCSYCGCPPHKSKRVRNRFSSGYIYNGIDRVDNNQGYILENCVPCCEICNRMKLKLGVQDFKDHINQIYNHWACK